MQEKEEEYYDESMFQNLSEASVRHGDESPINDLEYKYHMTVPDARSIFDDIGRDMMLANLSPEEIKVIRIKSNVIRDLDYIKKHHELGNDELTNLFRHDREVILVSSLSKDGFLRDNLISQIKKFRLDRKKDKQNNKIRFAFGKNTEGD